MQLDWTKREGSRIAETGFARALLSRHRGGAKDLLDIGVGNGLFAQSLTDDGFTVTGSDVACFVPPERIGALHAFVAMDAAKVWPFPDDSFDVVTAWNVLEHVPNATTFAKEAFRVLRPGGTLVMSMPNIFNLKNRLGFLRSGDMYRFKPSNGHITILTKLVFRSLFLTKRFVEIERGFFHFEAPFARVLFLPFARWLSTSEFFSKTWYVVVRKP